MQVCGRWVRSAVVGAGFCVVFGAVPARASHFHRGPTSSHTHKANGTVNDSHRGHHGGAAAAGHPRAIDDARATEIQTALVKAGYLQASSGKWDTTSADAMRKLQGDNGWQTKIIPDSRALIKLGLGPGSEAPGTVEGIAPATNAAHADLPHGQQ